MRCRQPARGCGAGWQRGSLSLGGRRSSRAGGHSPAPLPALLPPCTACPASAATLSPPPMSPELSPGACHRAGFCRPPQAAPALQDLGENSRINVKNVNKCSRTVHCNHPGMKMSRSWAGWWEEMGIGCCLPPPPPQPPCALLRMDVLLLAAPTGLFQQWDPILGFSQGRCHHLCIYIKGKASLVANHHGHYLLLQTQMKEGR